MSILEEIFARKAIEVSAAQSRVSLDELKRQIRDVEPPRGFERALRQTSKPVSLIAEIKKASPSKGVIRADFDPAEIAQSYERAGAHALSVLTDEHYFQGSAENLRIAKRSTSLPCLRKDFLDDPYQVYEARAWGADAILLIEAGLSDEKLRELYDLATDELGMDVLVEVHTKSELERAVSLKARIVGVNNRDLGDFKTDLAISQDLLPHLPEEVLKVSESALETHGDIDFVHGCGAKVVLIGTTFTSTPDIEAKVREVMHW